MNSIWHYYLYLVRRYLCSYRIAAILVITLIMMDTFVMPIRTYCEKLAVKMSPWGFALIWDNKYVGLCFVLIYVFASSLLPADRVKERYIIVRIGISKWVAGQALYIMTVGWVYTIFLYICLNLLLLNVMEFTTRWGMGWGTLSNNNVVSAFGIYTTVPYLAISNYDPVYANLLVIIIMGLLLGMIGMLIFWLNFYSRVAGAVITSGVVFLALAARKNPALQRYSPVSWIRLESHYRITNVEQPTVTYIIGMLVLLTILFYCLAKVTAKQTQENGRRKD